MKKGSESKNSNGFISKGLVVGRATGISVAVVLALVAACLMIGRKCGEIDLHMDDSAVHASDGEYVEGKEFEEFKDKDFKEVKDDLRVIKEERLPKIERLLYSLGAKDNGGGG